MRKTKIVKLQPGGSAIGVSQQCYLEISCPKLLLYTKLNGRNMILLSFLTMVLVMVVGTCPLARSFIVIFIIVLNFQYHYPTSRSAMHYCRNGCYFRYTFRQYSAKPTLCIQLFFVLGLYSIFEKYSTTKEIYYESMTSFLKKSQCHILLYLHVSQNQIEKCSSIWNELLRLLSIIYAYISY